MNNIIAFLPSGQDLSLAYLNTYDMPLVVLSVLMAVFASFMALELSGRIVHATTTVGKIAWLVPGAIAMGGGVWAMHFIGMLAFSLPCGISYDPIQTLASMVPGVVASAAALWIISRENISLRKLWFGGVLMGGGIGTMHYSGMAAMQLDAVIYYSPTMFGLSVGFAILLAILSLHAKFELQRLQIKVPNWVQSLIAGTFMGIAISGMHYIAMEAAYFIPTGDTPNLLPGIKPTVLAAGIGITTVMLVALTLAGSILGRHLETIHVLKREIRERKQAEQKIRKLSHAVEQSSAAVVITDLDGNIEYVNRKFIEVTHYSAEEVIGKNPRLLKSGHTSAKEYKNLWETITSGHEWRGEFHNKRKDGTLYWESASISPIKGRDGTIINYVATKEDITERKEAEKMLVQAKEEAECANRAKSQFLAGMSHDLRTPLNAIIGFSEMMERNTFGALGNAHYDEYVGDILDSGRFLLDLINDILDLSKIEAGKFELIEMSVNVGSLIHLSTKQISIQSNTAKVRLMAEVPDDLPLLWGDERAIVQILHNLISNAVKFTSENGKVIVSTNINEDGALEVHVQDNGIGIPKDKIAHVLEPFVQTDSYIAKEYEGHGLGLALSNKFTKLHDGTLVIKSEVGKGTTVTLTFPVERVLQAS